MLCDFLRFWSPRPDTRAGAEQEHRREIPCRTAPARPDQVPGQAGRGPGYDWLPAVAGDAVLPGRDPERGADVDFSGVGDGAVLKEPYREAEHDRGTHVEDGDDDDGFGGGEGAEGVAEQGGDGGKRRGSTMGACGSEMIREMA
jgi:hypothetical protein